MNLAATIYPHITVDEQGVRYLGERSALSVP